jgi:hypothetical protein
MAFLSYINDADLVEITASLIQTLYDADLRTDLDRNKIDPFSALFLMGYYSMSEQAWRELEKKRQIQKSLENAIGTFHQRILGKMNGWRDLETGQVLDLRNAERRMVAEVKNKFNTTKGSHKKIIYDDLMTFLHTNPDYTAYYVEIIPSSSRPYGEPFVPPDNMEAGARRSRDDRLRKIDGYSFYQIAAREPDALKSLYTALPEVISVIKERLPQLFPAQKALADPGTAYFSIELFKKTYPWVR